MLLHIISRSRARQLWGQTGAPTVHFRSFLLVTFLLRRTTRPNADRKRASVCIDQPHSQSPILFTRSDGNTTNALKLFHLRPGVALEQIPQEAKRRQIICRADFLHQLFRVFLSCLPLVNLLPWTTLAAPVIERTALPFERRN